MKALTRVLFKQKRRLEFDLREGIDTLIELCNLLEKASNEEELFKETDRVLGLEEKFERQYEDFLSNIDKKYYLPFYWQDIFNFYSGLKKVLFIFTDYFNKYQIFHCKRSFLALFKTERKILENARSFFEEYIHNRKYTMELLKNNGHEQKDFSQAYMQIIMTLCLDEEHSQSTMKILELFEQLNCENRALQDTLQKTFIDTQI